MATLLLSVAAADDEMMGIQGLEAMLAFHVAAATTWYIAIEGVIWSIIRMLWMLWPQCSRCSVR